MNSQNAMNERLILDLNGALSMENAGLDRLENRIGEISLSEVKQQLQHHINETKEQQQRLQQLITELGGIPTQDRLGLPLPQYPQKIQQLMLQSMTKEEMELKRSEEDMIVESAEVACYFTIIQKAQVMGLNQLIDPLRQNLMQEEEMVKWIKENTPKMLSQLLPKIKSTQ